MESFELRQWNLVSLINKSSAIQLPVNLKPYVVVEIKGDGLSIADASSNFIQMEKCLSVQEKEISPIPITPERLAWFGFVIVKNHKWQDDTKTPLLYRHGDYFIQFITEEIIVFSRMNQTGGNHLRNVSFMHQVQNLFIDLTGKSLAAIMKIT